MTAVRWTAPLVLVAGVVLSACGGGAAGPQGMPSADATATVTTTQRVVPTVSIDGANVLQVVVDRGPSGNALVNTPFVTITLCEPGTDRCLALDHVLLDTGSSGLRVDASALPAGLALPTARTASGAAVGQCMQFASGYAWGSVRVADVLLGQQRVAGLAIQVIDDPAAPEDLAPEACRRTGASLAGKLDAKGILGVGPQRQDCGVACEADSPPGVYFACDAGGCTPAPVALAAQVANPVALLARHGNGVAVVMPPIGPGGAPEAIGALVLGIGTEANNQMGAAQVVAIDARGMVRTTYRDVAYDSFLDTGTNALFFPDADLPRCGAFYCPAQATALRAAIGPSASAARQVELTVDAPGSLAGDSRVASLGGPAASSFQWGLPFFFGRTVFIGLAGAQTPAGPGPFWAF